MARVTAQAYLGEVANDIPRVSLDSNFLIGGSKGIIFPYSLLATSKFWSGMPEDRSNTLGSIGTLPATRAAFYM